MSNLLLFFLGVVSGVLAFMQVLTTQYRLISKDTITLQDIERQFPLNHPAKNQAIRQILYNTTPDRHRTLRKQDE